MRQPVSNAREKSQVKSQLVFRLWSDKLDSLVGVQSVEDYFKQSKPVIYQLDSIMKSLNNWTHNYLGGGGGYLEKRNSIC